MSRHADLLRISGQHLKKIEDAPHEALNPNYLIFMIARDNMYMDRKNTDEKDKTEQVRRATVSRKDEEDA